MTRPDRPAPRAALDVAWRPRFHFTPARHWMNDPNELLYAEGLYHLFYQYSAQRPKYEAISWGHAVSRDLVRWRHLPVALRRTATDSIYSGSALVDFHDRGGFGDFRPCCIALFTTSRKSRTPEQRQTVDLAYSRDGGRRWHKFRGNPLLDPQRRSFAAPFVFSFPPDRSFRMLVGEAAVLDGLA